MNKRKCAFSIFGFKWLKLIGGYIATYPGGFVIHLSENKAVLLPYSQVKNERKRFSILRTFRLLAFSITIETGAEYLLSVTVGQMILRTYALIKNQKRQNIKNCICVANGDVLRISLHCALMFNLFIVLKSVIKFIKEKIKLLWQKNHKQLVI